MAMKRFCAVCITRQCAEVSIVSICVDAPSSCKAYKIALEELTKLGYTHVRFISCKEVDP